MDKLATYRNLIKQHLNKLAELANHHPTSDEEILVVFDEERDSYMLLSVGWRGKQRAFYVTLYVRIRNGKIYVEEDWTEDGIATALVREGVPHSDIVLAFHPPEMRQYTDFAAA